VDSLITIPKQKLLAVLAASYTLLYAVSGGEHGAAGAVQALQNSSRGRVSQCDFADVAYRDVGDRTWR